MLIFYGIISSKNFIDKNVNMEDVDSSIIINKSLINKGDNTYIKNNILLI